MASPVDAGRNTTSLATATATPISVNLPASIAAGDTLMMIMRVGNANITTPTGWTALFSSSVIGTEVSDDYVLIAWRLATGSEGATVAVTVSASCKVAAITWRITGAADPTVTPPNISTHAFSSAANATPNPTTVTPTGGSKDYLFMWLGGWEGEQTSPPTTPPTNYANWTGANTGTTGATASNARVAGGTRQLTAASEDPSAVTISVADKWSAWAVAIHPGAPAAPHIYIPVGYAQGRDY